MKTLTLSAIVFLSSLDVSHAMSCAEMTENGIHYGDRIEDGAYSFSSIKVGPAESCITFNTANWTKYSLSLDLVSPVSQSQQTIEANLCDKAFRIPYLKEYYRPSDKFDNYFLLIKNGNASGKLVRNIVCSPKMHRTTIYSLE